MHDIVPIKYFKCLKKLSKNLECFFFFKRAFFLKSLEEIATIAILIDKIVVMFGLEVIYVPDDVFAVGDGGESVDLIDGACFQQLIFLIFFNGYNFDGKLSHFFGIDGSIDFTKISFSNFLDQSIVINYLDHLVPIL